MSFIEEKKLRIFVVPETHWDRAWYLPFEVYRRKLVQLFDRLLALLDKDPDYATFVADGQTVVLEDYLAIRPEQRDKLTRYIKEGRIKVGPWYVLPDEYIVGGESLVRNLQQGMRIAKEMGKVMQVGYVPDPFGHVAQLPQILQNFGIGSFIFSRGLVNAPEHPLEFRWQAPDGSEVLAVLQHMGYNNASNLGYVADWCDSDNMVFRMKDALDRIEGMVERMAPYAATDVLLLNNGVDHHEAQPEIARIVAKANEKWPKATVRQAGYDDFIKTLENAVKGRKLPRIAHELTFPHGQLLKGVYSARAYLKQMNHQCETRLLHYAEPLEALAARANPKRTDERALLGYAWRLLLKNHPHDDICGCSIDRVHRDMVNRFERVDELAESIAAEALRDIANAMDHTVAEGHPTVVFNPTPRPRKGAQRLRLLFRNSEWEPCRNEGFRLVDGQGKNLPYTVAQDQEVMWMEVRKPFHWHAVDVVIDAGELPAWGFKTLYAQPAKAPAKVSKAVRAAASELENDFIKVRVAPNGTFQIKDKKTGATHKGLGLLLDVEDAGDEYNWADIVNTGPVDSAKVKAKSHVLNDYRLSATLRIDYDLPVPEGLTADRSARSGRLVKMPVTLDLTLRAGSPRLDIRVAIDNPARDHRVQMLFPTAFHVDNVQAGGHFDTVERSADPKQRLQYDPDMASTLCATEHFAGFVRIGDSSKGLAVFAKGICEYESARTRSGVSAAITLFRAVGWLSREDYARRPGNAGPPLPAPEAQMLGKQEYQLAVMPHKGPWSKADLAGEAMEMAQELLSERGDRQGVFIPEGHENRVKPVPREGKLPDALSLVELREAALVPTTIKRADQGRDWVVRLYNQAPETVKTTLRFGLPPKEVWETDLNEKRRRRLGSGDEVKLTVKGKQIVTLRLKY